MHYIRNKSPLKVHYSATLKSAPYKVLHHDHLSSATENVLCIKRSKLVKVQFHVEGKLIC